MKEYRLVWKREGRRDLPRLEYARLEVRDVAVTAWQLRTELAL